VVGPAQAEQAADGPGVDGKNEPPGPPLEAREAVEETLVGLLPSQGRREAEPLMPGQDGIDGMLEHRERGFEGQSVPQKGPQEVVAHGEEVGENPFPHCPSEDRQAMGEVLGSGLLSAFHGKHVAVEGS
jgi:hypothetical protein